MGADAVLVESIRNAYKDRESNVYKGLEAGIQGAGQAIGDAIKAKRLAENEAGKAEAKDIQEKKDAFGEKISASVIEMGGAESNIGMQEYAVAKADLFQIREEMGTAIENKNQDEIDALTIRYNNLVLQVDDQSENYQAIVSSWKPDENGVVLYDASIMNDEELRVHNLFLTDKNKKYAQNAETGEWGYEFVKKDDEGNPITTYDTYYDELSGEGVADANIMGEEEFYQQENEEGLPIYETEHFTLNQISEMGQMSDTKNGMVLMDYTTKSLDEFKKNPKTGGKTIQQVRREVDKIIPKTQKEMRSWLKGNPTENMELSVDGYLRDHPLLNESNYEALGVTEKQVKPEDGWDVINGDDLISKEDKDAMIEAILSGDNPQISHDILVDLYSAITHNTINGIPNVDYNEEENVSMSDASTIDGVGASTEEKLAIEDQAIMDLKTELKQKIKDFNFKKDAEMWTKDDFEKHFGVGYNDKFVMGGEETSIKELFEKGGGGKSTRRKETKDQRDKRKGLGKYADKSSKLPK